MRTFRLLCRTKVLRALRGRDSRTEGILPSMNRRASNVIKE